MTNVAKKKEFPAFLVLTIIALVAAVVLALTNEVTKGPIAEHANRARTEAFNAVLPAASYEEAEIPAGHDSVSALFKAKDESGADVGYTVVASASGYAGPVAVTLGVDPQGMVTGAVIGDTSFAETAGFGMRWKEETNRWEQFRSIDTANGGSIEAISGATVTSNAVLNATNAGVNCVNEVRGVSARDVVAKGAPAAKPIETVTLTGDIHEGSAPGYLGAEVRVQLTMDDANVVTGLAIDSTSQTPGFGTRAMEEPEFAKQFEGQSAPFELGKNIDGLSGATITSQAVVEAVNAACAAPANPDAVPFDLGGKEEEPSVETSAKPVPAGARTAAAPGFVGEDVRVTLTLDESGAIATLDIDVSDQVPPACDLVLADSFVNQFIGKTGPFVKGENVDIVSGATFTSDGVIDAVNAALEAPAAEASDAEVLKSSAVGFVGEDVRVNVTLDAEGAIATLNIDVSDQVPPACDLVLAEEFVNQFIGKKGPFVKGENVDGVTGATFTSDGVIAALNKLFPAEEAVEEAPAAEVLKSSAVGFVGEDVRVNVTLDESGAIATLEIDVSDQVPPACDLVLAEEFVNQFIGKKGPFVKGENVDGVTGATFTSDGVIAALNKLFPAEEAVEEAPAAEVLKSSAVGFVGEDVRVNVTLDAEGAIATLEIDVSDQVPPACDLVLAEEFVNQFIGKKGPFVKGENVDGVTGATFTSDGVIAALNKLFPAEEAVEEAPAAEVLKSSAVGFVGEDVRVNVTLDAEGAIATLDIDVSDQVPPACDLVLAEEFVNQFIGKKGPFVKGENVDGVTGATFTSDGVIAALNKLFPAEKAVEEAPAAEVLKSSAVGFVGEDVRVNVTLDESGAIATLDIDVSDQVPPACDLVLAEEFVNQFIGKKGPFVKGENVDGVTGATFTSDGVIAALNKLFPAEEAVEEAPAAEVLKSSAVGFVGEDVRVNVTLDAEGAIATLDIDVSDQVPPACDLVLADSFVNQFIGKKGPFVKGENVDGVTGATFTSDGVIAALNKLFPAEEAVEEAPAAEVLKSSAVGFVGEDVRVNVTLDAEGAIATLEIDVSDQVPPACDLVLAEEFVNQFVGKKGPFVKGENVDGVTGATFTSDGVIAALNKLFPAEEAVEEAPAAEVLKSSAVGFVGEDVRVNVTLDAEGAIATLEIDVSDQVPPACDLVLAEEFVNQFVGKKGPFVKGENVDGVTGATFTSDGVIAALNKLFPAEKAVEEAPAAEVLKSSAVGFVGEDVRVNVTLDESGAIATLDIDVSDQVPPACDLVLAEEFVNQFIGKKGPFVKGENVDGVTGATFTSDGVIAALNKLFPAEEAVEEAPAAEVLKSSAVGFVGEDVRVNVTLDESGAIATLEIDVSDQVPPACDLVLADSFVNQFIGKKGPFVKGENVDGVTGATFTSDGVIAALNKLFPAE